MPSASYHIVTYVWGDGDRTTNEAYAGGTLAELIGSAPLVFGGCEIEAVVRLDVSATGAAAEDISASVADMLADRHADDEHGIPHDWAPLFSRIGRDLDEVNARLERQRDDDAAEGRRIASDQAFDYAAAIGSIQRAA